MSHASQLFSYKLFVPRFNVNSRCADEPSPPSSPGLLTGVTGYVAVDHTLALTVLAFRGSHSLRNWAADLDIAKVPTDICPECFCHQGLYVDSLSNSLLVSTPPYPIGKY